MRAPELRSSSLDRMAASAKRFLIYGLLWSAVIVVTVGMQVGVFLMSRKSELIDTIWSYFLMASLAFVFIGSIWHLVRRHWR